MKKNNKKVLIFVCLLLMLSFVLSSCASEKNKVKQNEKSNNQQDGKESKGKYTAQGKIIKIDENGIHVQVKDKVQRYNIDKTVAEKHYIGEYVGINELDNKKYEVHPDESYDFKNRFTSTGDQIKRITGTIGEVKNDMVTAVTEMGNIKLTNPGNFKLKNGDQVMFDYVEMTGGNQMVSYYEEASKLNVNVKEISRDASGIMRIYATGKDKKEYDIQVNENTVTNFAHSSLKKEDNITVYPNEISGDIPTIVNAKLIIKD